MFHDNVSNFILSLATICNEIVIILELGLSLGCSEDVQPFIKPDLPRQHQKISSQSLSYSINDQILFPSPANIRAGNEEICALKTDVSLVLQKW